MSAASSASARTKPFLFDRSFDDPSKVYLPGEKFGPKVKVDLPKPKAQSGEAAGVAESAQKVEEPPPPPTKTLTEAELEAQLEAAREEGYVKGHTTALEEAETAREHYVADALNIVSQSLDGLEEQQAEANRQIGETALKLVYAVIEKVVPVHAQAHATDSVEALVREVLPLVYDEPSLTVRTHNMIADDVQSRLEEVCDRSNFSGTVSVTPDYELQPGDCRVEWQGGGADRNEARLWNDIRAIIADNIGVVDVEDMDANADAERPSDSTAPDLDTEPLPLDVLDSDDSESQVEGDTDNETLTTSDNTTEKNKTNENTTELEQEPGQPTADASTLDQGSNTDPIES